MAPGEASARQAMLPWHRRWRDPETWVRLRHGMSGAAVGAALVLLVVVLAFRGEASSAVVAFLPLLTISLLIAVPVIVLVATRRSGSDPPSRRSLDGECGGSKSSVLWDTTVPDPSHRCRHRHGCELTVCLAQHPRDDAHHRNHSGLGPTWNARRVSGARRHSAAPRSLQNAVGATIGVYRAGFGLFLLDDVAEQLRGQLLETWLLLIPAASVSRVRYASSELASAQGGKAVGLPPIDRYHSISHDGRAAAARGASAEFRSPRFALHSVPRADSGAVAGDTITISSNSSAVDTVRPGRGS